MGHSLRILPIRAYQRLQGLHQQGCVKCQYESIIMRKGWQSRDGNVKLPRRSISSLLSLICWFWENCQFHFNENIRSNELKVFHFFWSNFAPIQVMVQLDRTSIEHGYGEKEEQVKNMRIKTAQEFRMPSRSLSKLSVTHPQCPDFSFSICQEWSIRH